MTYDTKWERDYERTNRECIEAAAAVALKPNPRIWPAANKSLETRWNPGGYPMVKGRNEKTVTRWTVTS